MRDEQNVCIHRLKSVMEMTEYPTVTTQLCVAGVDLQHMFRLSEAAIPTQIAAIAGTATGWVEKKNQSSWGEGLRGAGWWETEHELGLVCPSAQKTPMCWAAPEGA